MPKAILALVCLTALAAGFEIPPLTSPVVDQAHVISPQDREYLDQLIRQVRDSSHAQLQVLTIPSLEGEEIEQASIRVVDKWKIGLKGDDKGVLLFVAVKEHKVRIEVGNGLEGDLPDISAWQIISEQIIPRFKAGDLSGGIVAGVQSIAAVAAPNVGVPVPQASHHHQHQQKTSPAAIIFLLIILIFLLSTPFGRTLLFWGILQGGFGGGGGGRGRDGWSGGGGGFSGGGASGDW